MTLALWLSLLAFWGALPPRTWGDETLEAGIEFFEKQVRPLLVEHCYECHSHESEANGELLLDSRPGMIKGGSRGSVLDAENPEKSLLIAAIQYHDADLKMPPEGKMPNEQIEVLKKWVEMGAPDPRQEAVSTSRTKTHGDRLEQAKNHWAYQPLLPPTDARDEISRVSSFSSTWARDRIDQYVVNQLASRDLAPSAEADRRTLIRRLFYDLIGLPPSLDDYRVWISDSRADWYEHLVTKLLSSPHFGERMARRWMDVVRYADNKGYVFREDREYTHAYRYRDWLIRSFNDDLPFDEFVRYQLVADRLDPENRARHLDAMGMLTLGRRFLQNKNDIVDDRIDVLCRGLMGVTASCARCHDHKFDPVSMADYYSLHGMFLDSDEPGGDPSPMRLVDKPKSSKTFVFLRGDPGRRGAEIEREFFGFFSSESRRSMVTGSGRFEVAESITDRGNPLTSRVFVNRVWGWLTGRPLVDTPSDFGLRCEPPIHQRLLDDLAWEFVESGWSTKQLVERIVLSSTYRQSSQSNPKSLEIDPENRWLWRANRRRLDFESYRDALLQVTGSLETSVGGPSIVIDKAPFSQRRTVYAYIDRQNLPQIFRSFDFASPDVHVPQRAETTVPQQSLALLNSEMVLQIVRDFVDDFGRRDRIDYRQLDRDAISASQLDWLFQRLLGRPATPDEIAQTIDFIRRCDTTLVRVPKNAWSYGFGKLDNSASQLTEFQQFEYFGKGTWSGSETIPDKKLGYALLRDKGGHPGSSLAAAAVRRWIATETGQVSIQGTLEHPSENGDGIRASILHNQNRLLGSWIVKSAKTSTIVDPIEVSAGDTIDFVVDCFVSPSHDDCQWTTSLQYRESSLRYDSKEDFSGLQPMSASPIQQVAHALLLTNEFCFVD